MTTGTTLRDRGISLADTNAPEGWKKTTDGVILMLSLTGMIFSAEDVRLLVGEPPNPNAFGSRFMNAIKKGWIKKVGYTNAKRPDAHARALAQYRGVGV